MEFQKCQRCWTQKALFRCPSCEKHQILCNKCDTYIHSMNKYKFHQRYGLNDNDELTQKETAKKLAISRSYVSRIEKKALLKLRNALLV